MTYDLAIIGAGPGGYVSAIRSAQLGLKTILIEKENVGGTCLNRGCIPTKSMAAVAERMLEMSHFAEFGIEKVTVSNAIVNITKVIERKDRIVNGFRNGIHQLLKSNKVDYVKSAAQFVSPTELKLTDDTCHVSPVTCHNVIIATGSTWCDLHRLTTDGNFIITSDYMLELKELPKKLVIIGGGAIGSEFASIMNAFGVDVTIVEIMEQILPLEDSTAARLLAVSFKKRGIKIYTKTTAVGARDGVVSLSTGENLEADKVLVSVGRRPYTDDLNLEAVGVETQNGFILADEKMRTNIPNIFAVGDVAVPRKTGTKPFLAHVASKEGIVAINNISPKTLNSQLSTINYNVIPRPIFTTPEVFSVGLTEKELKAQKYKTGRFSYTALSKAVCDGATEGIFQVYTDEKGGILGAFCMGSHASDICAEVSLAMQSGLTADDVINIIHAHPTYSEIVVEALEDTEGRAVHKVRKAKYEV